jgi:hypothetical protein
LLSAARAAAEAHSTRRRFCQRDRIGRAMLVQGNAMGFRVRQTHGGDLVFWLEPRAANRSLDPNEA